MTEVGKRLVQSATESVDDLPDRAASERALRSIRLNQKKIAELRAKLESHSKTPPHPLRNPTWL
jgi:hypothetical protein